MHADWCLGSCPRTWALAIMHHVDLPLTSQLAYLVVASRTRLSPSSRPHTRWPHSRGRASYGTPS